MAEISGIAFFLHRNSFFCPKDMLASSLCRSAGSACMGLLISRVMWAYCIHIGYYRLHPYIEHFAVSEAFVPGV